MKLHEVRPSGRFTRQPKTSALGIHRKGRGAETRGHVEKGANTRFGMAPKRGRRLS
jgi:hypothetical protein